MDQLLWLFPIFFTLHNLEEVPFMEGWAKGLPFKKHTVVTTRQFPIAITIPFSIYLFRRALSEDV